MKVRDLMHAPVFTVEAHDTVNEAAHIMWSRDIGAVPIVDDGRLIGMVTDRDIAMGAFLRGRPLASVSVVETMVPTVYMCGPDDTIEVAQDIMARHRVHRLPVVVDGALVGMLSTHDLLQASARMPRKVPPKDLVKALGAICEPRRPLVQQ